MDLLPVLKASFVVLDIWDHLHIGIHRNNREIWLNFSKQLYASLHGGRCYTCLYVLLYSINLAVRDE